jgi:hypothetical protein
MKPLLLMSEMLYVPTDLKMMEHVNHVLMNAQLVMLEILA